MEVVCPSCASAVESPVLVGAASESAGTCPHCGFELAAATVDPCASDPALAQLSDELRDAFGAGAFALDSRPSARADSDVTLSVQSTALPSAPAMPGGRLGDFELIELIGHGGMGVVYRARQISLNREVALKVLPPFARRRRASVTRFLREGQAAARLHHTNIVPIYAQGECEDKFYYAMELIDGESLDSALRDDSSVVSLTLRRSPARTDPAWPKSGIAERGADAKRDITGIPRGRADYQRIARLLAEVADALNHAHASGVIHRDIKPQNLLLGRDGRLHITDFGLAHLMNEPHLTQTGEIMGTPAYMSPEQVSAAGGEIDPRTDIYSLGVTLYELLTLRRPFEGHTREQVLSRIAESAPRPPRQVDPRIPRDLETICLRTIEKEPARRYASAADLASDLRRFADDRPILTRRVGPLGRTIRWVRRHKGASASISAVAAALLLTAALAASMAASRRREAATAAASRQQQAEQLIQSSYDQLVYRDYQSPGQIGAALDRAEELGGDIAPIARLRALATIVGDDRTVPIAHLEEALAAEPENVETLYMLAWAYARAGQQWPSFKQMASETINRADAAGGAETATEWFFRGLALHSDQPQEAIACYQRARDIRAAAKDIFPQATIHLARARNQLMYRTRDITGFAESDRALRELIDHKLYGGNPYYLLSIANRMVAEIYADSKGTRDGTADRYFTAALDWARQGQIPGDPKMERAITAEAECLESMGRFDEAIEARTRAIPHAPTLDERAEARGYRWRLYYWTNQLDEALEDLAFLHGEYDKKSEFFGRVYPALIHAEADRMDEALRLARSIAEAAPDDAQKIIWSSACLRILGRSEEAQELLVAKAKDVGFDASLFPPQNAAWVEQLYRFVVGAATIDDLLALAQGVDPHWKLTGEAYFHAGVLKLAAGDRGGAQLDFDQAYRSFDDQRRYTFHAQVLRMKLRADPHWPRWITAENNGNSGDSGGQ